MSKRFRNIVDIDERFAHIERPGTQHLAPSRLPIHVSQTSPQCIVDEVSEFQVTLAAQALKFRRYVVVKG